MRTCSSSEENHQQVEGAHRRPGSGQTAAGPTEGSGGTAQQTSARGGRRRPPPLQPTPGMCVLLRACGPRITASRITAPMPESSAGGHVIARSLLYPATELRNRALSTPAANPPGGKLGIQSTPPPSSLSGRNQVTTETRMMTRPWDQDPMCAMMSLSSVHSLCFRNHHGTRHARGGGRELALFAENFGHYCGKFRFYTFYSRW